MAGHIHLLLEGAPRRMASLGERTWNAPGTAQP
jgi:hypothetical protein